MKKLVYVFSLVVIASMILAACGGAATPTAAPVPTEPPATQAPTEVPATEPPTEPPAPAFTAPEGALVAYPVDAAPTLDGVADDAAWANAQETTISVAGGFNNFGTDVTIKSVYDGDNVYFLLSYADPSESWFRSPWQKQEDGTWKQIKDPNDKGGDNNAVYEDKFALIWPINNSIKNFETAGCFLACHAGENSDVKPFGNKYTSAEGELGDIWHWKSIRNDGQIDDQYLDWTKFDAEKAKEAGRKSDKKDSGGYADNFASMPDPADASKTVPDKSRPGFTSPSVDLTTGAPGYILDSEKVALDQAALDALPVGTYLPGIVKSPIVGDRGDISAAWKWADGVWTIEFSRKLTTGSETDVQFSDLAGIYYFGVAVFENAQVRHAFQTGSTAFVFMP
ncbi:MAG TPA: ethylbenzene dehydrogenase-related protein [Anaerolineales bacterium]|nr:ethylbenzene dehydrogenase-related protein [Anaerolineales bacterium]